MLLFIFLILTFGCVQMRDYTGAKEGAFGLDIKKGFGGGVDKKDYYLIRENEGLTVGDTNNEVIYKIGLPAKIETTQEGYEAWIYEDRNLRLLFEDEKLREWQDF